MKAGRESTIRWSTEFVLSILHPMDRWCDVTRSVSKSQRLHCKSIVDWPLRLNQMILLSQLKKTKEKEEHTCQQQKPNTPYRSLQSLNQLNLLLSIKVVQLRINIKSKIMKDTRGTKIPVRGTRRATRDSLPCFQSGTPRMEAVVLHWTCPWMMEMGLQ